ncbi:hypothetical protein [Metallosphaera sp.]|uniref:hypothetical protein n=1 Tax=Metallosphaera sp. TaxID=2020860 RepID=UPI00316923D0
MSEWIKEMSFKLTAAPQSLLVQCNCRGKILELQKDEKKFSLRFLSDSKRVSFENGKLFDFHSLSVIKGDEAKSKMADELREFVPAVIEDLSSLYGMTGIPIDLPKTCVEDIGNLYFDERRYLDFSTTYVEFDLGREFLKDKPGFTSERRLKLTVLTNNGGLRTVHWLESSRGEVYASKDRINWNSAVQEFTDLLSVYRPTSEIHQQIKSYMLAFVSP